MLTSSSVIHRNIDGFLFQAPKPLPSRGLLKSRNQTMTIDAKTITRRSALGLLAAGAGGYAAFGPERRRLQSGGRVVLDYWEKWTGHEAAAMQVVVDRFNESQAGIFVNYLTMGGIDQKAKVAIAAGDPPDVLGLWNRNLPFFSQCGAIMPLDQLKDYGIDGSQLRQGGRSAGVSGWSTARGPEHAQFDRALLQPEDLRGGRA